MATPEQPATPAPLEEVEAPAEVLSVPTTKPQDSEYLSSEHLQRAHSADVFAQTQAKEKKQTATQSQKLQGMLDKYIKEHGSTVAVRKLAKKHKRTNELQMEISADLVEILEKIKSEVR